MNDNYTAPSGGSIYAGMAAPASIPSWIVNQPVNTWGVVPATNTIADLDPRNNPAYNSLFPAPAYWSADSGQSAIISKWNGAALNYIDSRLRIFFSGGHADYGGNEHYEQDYLADPPNWRMVIPPSGAISAAYPSGFVTDVPAQESTGLFTDGMPRTSHSYNKLAWVPDVGWVVANQSGVYRSAGAGTNKQIIYNDDGTLQYFNGSFPASGSGSSGMGCCYDPSRHCLWVKAVGTSQMYKWDIATKVWTAVGTALSGSSYTGMAYIPEHDCVFVMRQNQCYAFNCATGSWVALNLSASLVGMPINGEQQPVYIDNNTVAVWDNDTQTTLINTLSFASNPYSETWQVSQLPVAPGNTVTPTAAQQYGTYGRFQWVPNLRIFVLVNAVNQPTYFYKMGA